MSSYESPLAGVLAWVGSSNQDQCRRLEINPSLGEGCSEAPG